MLFSNQPLRSTLTLKSHRKSVSPPSISLANSSSIIQSLHSQNVLKTKQSIICDSMKSSIMSDSQYNSMIYEWRKVQTAPIVKVVQLAKMSQIDEGTGLQLTQNTIRPEVVLGNLINFKVYTKEELLYVFKALLDGHQAIFRKIKATSVSIEKCFVTSGGLVKVWVNQYLERNQISGEVLNKEELIVQKVFQIFSFICEKEPKMKEFITYVNASMKRNGKWAFSFLRALIKSYSDCLKIKMITNLNGYQPNPNHMLSSFVSNKTNQTEKTQKNKKRRQNSYFGQQNTEKNNENQTTRNIQSSMSFTRGVRRASLTTKFNNKQNIPHVNVFNSFINNNSSTCRSINENYFPLKTLVKNEKHSNSVSGFEEILKDGILQHSRHVNHEQHKEQNDLLKRKIPSINQIVLSKFGIQQVQDQYYASPYSSSSPTPRYVNPKQKQTCKTLRIISQVQVNINNNKLSPQKYKLSSISTSNQTIDSGFAKKLQNSHSKVHFEQATKYSNFQTASKDRFDGYTLQQLPHIKIGSCTNWAHNSNNFDLGKLIQKVKQSQIQNFGEYQDQIKQSGKLQIEKQVLSFQHIDLIESPKKNKQNMKQMGLFKQIKSEEELQSYYGTQKNSIESSPSRKRIQVEEKIMQLLNINRRLAVSTYIDKSCHRIKSEKQCCNEETSKKLLQIQQTLCQLIKVKEKQQQIMVGNCWTKKLQNLLGLDDSQMKQSISFGTQQASALLRQIKLSRLGKWGKDIGHSIVAIDQKQ